jgi:hypothetical protein
MVTRSTTAGPPSASAILFAGVQIGAAWLPISVGIAAFHTFQWARACNTWLNERAVLNMNRFDRARHG